MKARLEGRARSDCSTSTIGGDRRGDMATTSASGMSWPSTAAQVPDMGSDSVSYGEISGLSAPRAASAASCRRAPGMPANERREAL